VGIGTLAGWADEDAAATIWRTPSEGGGDRMSWKPKKFDWKTALFSLASLATLALAVGARYKPK